MKLYHGSSTNIEKYLKPHRAFDRDDYSPCVYFARERERALIYAVNPIEIFIKNNFNREIHCSAISAHFYDRTQQPALMEMYPDMFEEIYRNRHAYIYVCDIAEEELSTTFGYEYTVNREVPFVEKIYIGDVLRELLLLQGQGKLRLLTFDKIDRDKTYLEREHLIDSLRIRKQYCKTQEEKDFFEMVAQYLPIK